MARKQVALSLKQPWATLLAHGVKTIEVRRWSTPRRGPVLIHAARHPDPRPEVWKRVPAHLREETLRSGGIVGRGEIIDCVRYGSRELFAAQAEHHLNDPDWFNAPALYGFVFVNLQVLPFRPYSGWMRFFEVEEE